MGLVIQYTTEQPTCKGEMFTNQQPLSPRPCPGISGSVSLCKGYTTLVPQLFAKMYFTTFITKG